MRLTAYCNGMILGLALLVPGIAWGGDQKTIVEIAAGMDRRSRQVAPVASQQRLGANDLVEVRDLFQDDAHPLGAPVDLELQRWM